MDTSAPAERPTLTRRQVAGFVLAAAVLGAFALVPSAGGLTPAAWRLAGLFCAGMVLWITEALPVAVTALFVVAAQPLLGIATMPAAGAGFMSPVIFFVLAMFLIAAVINESKLDQRFALWLLAKAGTDSRRVLLAFMSGTAAISTFVSDVPACAIWAALAITLLARNRAVPGCSNFGRALMLGVPIAAFIGGVGTPAGSSVNVLGLQLLKQFGGTEVAFLHWMVIGLPMVVILTPAAWWVLMKVYPPEIASVEPPAGAAGSWSSAERKGAALLVTLLALWIASTWWPRALDATMIAVLGSVAMFLPGLRLLTWHRAMQMVSWDALFMIGGITSLGVACRETGLAQWFVDHTLGGMNAWHPILIIAAISTVTVLIHLVIPILPAVVAVLVPPIVLLAQQSGQSPALYALPVIFTASCGFLLPLDAVSLITYRTGYYRMTDMLLPGAIISLFWVILMTALIYGLGPAIGLR
jgi:sodium-dependent dicarboxylate transporter 2/3/5